jgi:hypothetical protein
MSGVFYIPGLNGLRWTLETFTPTPNLNSLPADLEIDQQSYAVPIQKTDTEFPALVLLSDFPTMVLEFLTCQNKHISYEALAPTSSSLVNQSFLQYLATVNFGAFPIGRCYGRVTYDSNIPAILNGKLTEDISPLVDGILDVKVNGVTQYQITTTGTNTVNANAGLSYTFTALSAVPSVAVNPRIRLTVTKTVNNVATVIYDKSEVQTGANNFTYSGVAQPGATYLGYIVTEDTAVVVAPINIVDTVAVTPNPVSWISCPVDVQQVHPLTQLFQYSGSKNKESVLFNLNPGKLILQTRIEANMIGGYEPVSDRTDYLDQPYNLVLLNGFNSDIYTNYYTGYELQIPNWRIQQLSLIWAQCDEVKIDYDFYVAKDDIKFERPEGTTNRNAYNANQKIQIVKGYQFGQLTAGTTPTGDLIVVRKTWPAKAPFNDFATSFVISGVFTAYSVLDYFETVNSALATFILKVGITAGGNEIYEGEIGTPNADTSIELRETHRPLYPFNGATNVYVTIPAGIVIKFIPTYDQLDSAPVVSGGGTGKVGRQGTACYYKELVAGYFTRDWNIATGLGQIGSEYEGCQIIDQAANRVIQAWNRLNNDTVNPTGSRGTPGVAGANQVGVAGNSLTIVQANLPNIGLGMFSQQQNDTPHDQPGTNDWVAITSDPSGQTRKAYEMAKGTIATPSGITRGMNGGDGKGGAGTAINIANDGLIYLFYIQL